MSAQESGSQTPPEKFEMMRFLTRKLPLRGSLQLTRLFLATSICSMGANAGAQTLPRISFTRPNWKSPEAFTSITAFRELSNGAVLVADFQEVQVSLINPTDNTSKLVGRKGSGPAEYTAPARLIALTNDTTFLLDRDSRRYLLIDGSGRITTTQQIPTSLADGATTISYADAEGRLYFRGSIDGGYEIRRDSAYVNRWKRGSNTFERVAVIALENPKPEAMKINGNDFVVRRTVRFAPVDDWVVSSSGRLAIVQASPYRVDWIESNGAKTTGTELSYTPVPVTDADKKTYEPKGPPYVRQFAAVKSPFFSESSIVDNEENIWVMRNVAFGSKVRSWDVFSAKGKPLGSVPIPINRQLVSVTRRFAYCIYTDNDGLQWLERYAR